MKASAAAQRNAGHDDAVLGFVAETAGAGQVRGLFDAHDRLVDLAELEQAIAVKRFVIVVVVRLALHLQSTKAFANQKQIHQYAPARV